MIAIRDSRNGAAFAVRVQPRGSRTGITGTFGAGPETALKVTLAAPPLEDRANQELIEFFSMLFRVPRSAVHIVAGEHSRSKVIRIAGRSAAEIEIALRDHLTV